MSTFLVLTLCVFVPLINYADCSQNRIVGGVNAEEGAFPYQISLRKNGKHFCGGSIIDDFWILTAAHCVQGQDPSQFTVVAGTNRLDSGGDTYKVKQFIQHENYQPSNISNDIALINLNDPVTYKGSVQKIELATEEVPPGTQLVLSGWGTTTFPGRTPNRLQTIKLYSISKEKCICAHGEEAITNRNICTFTRIGQGACHGDSGGPLVREKKQVGVVSWGIPCALGKPDVFTKVSYYLDWISDHKK